MIDIGKQITYWQKSAREDWEVAIELVGNNRSRHGLYFAHLALEKILKAHICKETHDLAPKIHNLIDLAQLANLVLNPHQSDILTEMNSFNIRGRYPDSLSTKPTKEETRYYIRRAEEMFKWLMSLL
jgi:HEPN domain-containing protein